MEHCFDIAHLGHVEMYTDRYDESLDFFTRVYGLKLSVEDKTSACLWAWDDSQAWGGKTIETFHSHGTPPVKKEH